jgi:hypothetical protein
MVKVDAIMAAPATTIVLDDVDDISDEIIRRENNRIVLNVMILCSLLFSE